MSVCVRERERERERDGVGGRCLYIHVIISIILLTVFEVRVLADVPFLVRVILALYFPLC